MSPLTQLIQDVARDAGADTVAVCDASPFPEARARLVAHKETGMSGPLHFTFDHPDEAADVGKSYPWARSLVILGHDYLGSTTASPERGAVVARFATADHYRPLRKTANTVAAALTDRGHRAEILVDDNRLADRLPAIRSGMGWQGRSTMILSPGHGPWLLLGTVVTDASLEPSAPSARGCGACTACIPACPTGALDQEGLDARRCMSTWLQTAGAIPLWIRPRLGRRIYGCDDCLIACPPGLPRLRSETRSSDELPFTELLAHTDEELVRRFAHWYIPRRRGRYLRRNILVAAGNSGERSAWGPLTDHLDHRSSLIRGHAAWALARSGAPHSSRSLWDMLETETSTDARAEAEIALLMLESPKRYDLLLIEDERRRAGSAPGGVAEAVAQRHHRLGVDLADPGLGDA